MEAVAPAASPSTCANFVGGEGAERLPEPAAGASMPPPLLGVPLERQPEPALGVSMPPPSPVGMKLPSKRKLSPLLSPESPALVAGFGEFDEGALEWWTPELLEGASPILFALEELKGYFAAWEKRPRDEFWQRKSGKPVLSVVVARKPDSGLVSYRGTNTEVSLPAGSVCAECAAIARMASDLMPASAIAVVASVDPTDRTNPLWPSLVGQSWLSKLSSQNPRISVVAVSSVACERFTVCVNGEPMPPPLSLPPTVAATASCWSERVVLAEGVTEQPWEAQETVYVDGAWTFMHAGHQSILRLARSRGTHLLVGVHSDALLERVSEIPVIEDFDARVGRVLQIRTVCSVLKDAPWSPSEDMIRSLGIKIVVTGSVSKIEDMGAGSHSTADPYLAPRRLGILETLQSSDTMTERWLHNAHFALATEVLQLMDDGGVIADADHSGGEPSTTSVVASANVTIGDSSSRPSQS